MSSIKPSLTEVSHWRPIAALSRVLTILISSSATPLIDDPLICQWVEMQMPLSEQMAARLIGVRNVDGLLYRVIEVHSHLEQLDCADFLQALGLEDELAAAPPDQPPSSYRAIFSPRPLKPPGKPPRRKA